MEEYVEAGIIEPQALAALMDDKKTNISVLDATFIVPGTVPSYTTPSNSEEAEEHYEIEHIQGARFFDITKISDQDSELPNMLPSQDEFETHVSKLGVKNEDLIVVYGMDGMVKGPARAWWMFKTFGHKNVVVLNGGLPAWKAAGLPLVVGKMEEPKSSFFEAKYNPHMVRDLNDVLKASSDPQTLILDARPNARFSGETPEPREGMRSGHIPGSKNLPCSTLVDPQSGKLKSESEIRNLLNETGYTENQPIITTCGSGVTACMIVLALYNVGIQNIPVYDGSWSEWGRESKNLPIEQDSSQSQQN